MVVVVDAGAEFVVLDVDVGVEVASGVVFVVV